MPRYFLLLALSCSIYAQNLPSIRWIKEIAGSGQDSVAGIGTDANGNVYVAGTTSSIDLPVKNAIQPHPASTGLYRIDNDLGTSTFAALGLPQVSSITIDPRNPNVVYAAGGSLKRSTDGGLHWPETLNVQNAGVRVVAIDPTNSSILYAGTFSQGIFKSTDSGATWTLVNVGLFVDPSSGIAIHRIWIDPANPHVLFAADLNSRRSFRSADGGATWIDTGLPSLSGIWFDSTTPGVVYASRADFSNNLLKSLDHGATFASLTQIPATQGSPQSITSDPSKPGRLIVATEAYIYESTDDGASWNLGLTTFGGNLGITADWASGYFYELNLHAVVRISTDLKTVLQIGPPSLDSVGQLAASAGRVFVATAGSRDVFVTKFSPTGDIVWSTYCGGSATDSAAAIVVDRSGNTYVAGQTSSADFPTTANAYAKKGTSFIFKLTSEGNIVYSTYLLPGSPQITSMAVDAAGEAIVAGITRSDLVTVGGFQNTYDGPPCGIPFGGAICAVAFDGFGAKLDATGSSLLYSTYLPSWYDVVPVAAGPDGSAYFGSNRNLLHVNAAGSRLINSTVLKSIITALSVDNTGDVYVAGQTSPTDNFVATPGALLPAPLGFLGYETYGFIASFTEDLQTLHAATLLGGGYGTQIWSIAFDQTGNLLVGGGTAALGLQTRAPLASSFYNGTGFASVLAPDLSSLRFSTYLGDAELFSVRGIAPSPDGDFVIAGYTGAILSNFPVHTYLNKVTLGDVLQLRLDSALDAASQENTPLSPGKTLTLRGAGFTPSSRLWIGDREVMPIALDANSMTVSVPNDVTPDAVGGSVHLQVRDGAARSNSVLVSVVAALAPH